MVTSRLVSQLICFHYCKYFSLPFPVLTTIRHFSTATASYRLLPEITIKQEIVGDLADKFAACFAPGVIEVKKEKGKKMYSCFFLSILLQ